MGSDLGVDIERPVHRVFVDQFASPFRSHDQLYRIFVEPRGHQCPRLERC